MGADLTKIRVHVREHLMGDVMGELTRCGAWLDDVRTADGLATITVRAPREEVPQFEKWLGSFTGGAGKVELVSS
jgi:translation elongation factor EF-G